MLSNTINIPIPGTTSTAIRMHRRQLADGLPTAIALLVIFEDSALPELGALTIAQPTDL